MENSGDDQTENPAASPPRSSGSGLGISQELTKPKPISDSDTDTPSSSGDPLTIPKEKDVFCDPSSASSSNLDYAAGPYILPTSKINDDTDTDTGSNPIANQSHGLSEGEGPKSGQVYDNIKLHLQPTLERLKQLSKLEPTKNVAAEILASLGLLEIISRQPLHPVIDEKGRKKADEGVRLIRQGTDLIVGCRNLLRTVITEDCEEYSTYVEGMGEIYDNLKGHLRPILERLKEVSEMVIITSDVGLEMVESIRLLKIICKSPVQPVIEDAIKKAERGAAKLWAGERKIAGVQFILRSAIPEEIDFSLPLPKIWNRLPSLTILSSVTVYSDSDSD